jgi:hypothetical protein
MAKYTFTTDDDTFQVRGDGEPLDLWDDLRTHFLRLRGGRRGPGRLRYPNTTNHDVALVVTVFNTALDEAPDVTSLDTERKAWQRAVARIQRLSNGADLDAPYVDNSRLWLRDTKRLATFLTVARYLPTRTEVLEDLADLTRHRPQPLPVRNGRRAA